jgi:hypothetical protein
LLLAPFKFSFGVPHLIERPQEVLVLVPNLLEYVLRLLGKALGNANQGLCGEASHALAQVLAHLHGRAPARPGIDLNQIHEAAGAQNAHSHSSPGLIAAVQNAFEVRNTRPLVDDPDSEHPARFIQLDEKFRLSADGVGEGVARDFRYGGSGAGLFLGVKAKQLRNLTGSSRERRSLRCAR